MRASDIIKHVDNVDIKAYVTRMRMSSTWGGAIEIRAYNQLFQANICVKVLHTGKNIEFLYKRNSPLSTISWNGSHFEPVRNPTRKRS
jgi:hypothetical protein